VKFLAIKGFDAFQHYRNRRPPWIKFYADVLTDAAMMQLPEAAQAQLFKLWLLASQMGNPLPNNPKLLAGKIATQGKSYLPLLIEAGFVVLTDASAPLAESEQDASADASRTLGHIDQRRKEQNLPVDLVADPLTALAVWCNLAITERWGEQTRPLRRDLCSDLAQTVLGMDGAAVKDSIFAQCRTKSGGPPTHPNYFRKGVAAAWEREGTRRAVVASGEQPPAIRVIKPRGLTKSDAVDAELTEFLGVNHGE
jgi:hypothetical protein